MYLSAYHTVDSQYSTHTFVSLPLNYNLTMLITGPAQEDFEWEGKGGGGGGGGLERGRAIICQLGGGGGWLSGGMYLGKIRVLVILRYR